MLYKGFWGANPDICPESEAQRAPKHLLNEDKWEHRPNLPKWEHQSNQQIKDKKKEMLLKTSEGGDLRAFFIFC